MVVEVVVVEAGLTDGDDDDDDEVVVVEVEDCVMK